MKHTKFKQAKIEQWARLYKVAGEIKLITPWERLWDSELFTIWLPNFSEPILVSVMGRNDECYGITVYPGFQAIMSYYELAGANEEEPFYIKMANQNCLTCYYGDRDELIEGEREVIKQLGLKFRGHNNWIYFRSMKTGYYPWMLDEELVVLMADVLEAFLAAFIEYEKGSVKVDFNKDETVTRRYDTEKGEWKNSVEILPQPEVKIPNYIINDDIFIKSIKNKAKKDISVEFDMVYLPFSVQKSKDEMPYMPCLVILVDRESGFIFDQNIVGEEENEEDVIFSILRKFFDKYGRPSMIYVRNYHFERYIKDFCKKAEIRLTCGEKMSNINYCIESMIEYMNSK